MELFKTLVRCGLDEEYDEAENTDVAVDVCLPICAAQSTICNMAAGRVGTL